MTAAPENLGSAILLISCPDKQGIDAAVTKFVSDHNGNIIHFDQHVDFQQNIFFMRIEWELASFTIAREDLKNRLAPLAKQYDMQWEIHFSNKTPRMAIFVSKQSHCLYDMLSRHQAGEWHVEIPIIISNHPDHGEIARQFGLNYLYTPITAETKEAVQRKQIETLQSHQIDLIVLARYMQILGPSFVDTYPQQIINIHHSFLPAFPGAKPYHSAHARGVKLIGATSHNVTAELDAGPIIEQDTIRVGHKNTIADLVRRGRDLEKMVLSRAIWHHLQRKVLVYNNKTVIFD